MALLLPAPRGIVSIITPMSRRVNQREFPDGVSGRRELGRGDASRADACSLTDGQTPGRCCRRVPAGLRRPHGTLASRDCSSGGFVLYSVGLTVVGGTYMEGQGSRPRALSHQDGARRSVLRRRARTDTCRQSRLVWQGQSDYWHRAGRWAGRWLRLDQAFGRIGSNPYRGTSYRDPGWNGVCHAWHARRHDFYDSPLHRHPLVGAPKALDRPGEVIRRATL